MWEVALFAGAVLGTFGGAMMTIIIVAMPQRERMRALGAALSKTQRELEKAKVDRAIVQALDAGDLSSDDLHELGLRSSTVTATAPVGLNGWARLQLPACPKRPTFRSNLIRRKPHVSDLSPGDQVWVHACWIRRDDDGGFVLANSNHVDTYQTQDGTERLHLKDWAVRIRVYSDRSLELAIPASTDLAISAGQAQTSDFRIARLRKLGSSQVLELATGETWTPDEDPGLPS